MGAMRAQPTSAVLTAVAAVALALAAVEVRTAPSATACPDNYMSTRLGGNDRIDTAVAVSQRGFPQPASARTAVVTRADTFADALAGGPLAIRGEGPLLLTPPDHLDERARAELRRAVMPGATVFVLGSDDAIAPTVASMIALDGFQVLRLGGADRYETAVRIAHQLGDPRTILLATGNNFPDGLVAGAVAGQAMGAILLTDDDRMPPVNHELLSRAHAVYAFGDQAAGADPSAIAVRGTDRYDTSVRAARLFFAQQDQPAQLGVATGENFPDALAGGALVTEPGGGPLLLTPPDRFPRPQADYLGDHVVPIEAVYIYGQEDVVSPAVKQRIDDVIVGSCGP